MMLLILRELLVVQPWKISESGFLKSFGNNAVYGPISILHFGYEVPKDKLKWVMSKYHYVVKNAIYKVFDFVSKMSFRIGFDFKVHN